MSVLVAILLSLIALPMVGYPALLWLRARLSQKPNRPPLEALPQVDLVICAYNEAAHIGAKIENALALDYPADALHIWVASDGSDDATVDIARSYDRPNLTVLDLPRAGKAAALAASVGRGHAPIIAFSDANSAWRADALRNLVAPLCDPEVGAVAGNQVYRKSDDPETAGETGYWSYDRMLKAWQSDAGEVVSATGAIYCIRRELFAAPPPDATDDFMISTGAVAAGQRIAFALDAIALEPPAARFEQEFSRKVRVITRGLRSVYYRSALMNPLRTGFYGLQLFVHKLWRRLVWVPAVALILLWPFADGWTAVICAGSTALVAAGAAALAFPKLRGNRLLSVCAYVVMVNAACAVACWRFARGQRTAMWQADRSTETRGSRS